nr:DNA topoisomerase 2 [Tanacetum cinerariifolium]
MSNLCEIHPLKVVKAWKFFLLHRRWLEPNHSCRFQKERFDGIVENRGPPTPLTGLNVLKQLSGIRFKHWKSKKSTREEDVGSTSTFECTNTIIEEDIDAPLRDVSKKLSYHLGISIKTKASFGRQHQNEPAVEMAGLLALTDVGKSMGKKLKEFIISENWCMVSFKPDLAKFGTECLEDDIVALMKRRVVDLAGCFSGVIVKVELDGTCVLPRTFEDYVELYLETSDRIYEKVNDTWEICVAIADGHLEHFDQVSFVNNIATMKGGSHVDYITSQITDYLAEIVDLQPNEIKRYLWVFVNALADSYVFKSFQSNVGRLDIPELKDANLADTPSSQYCTLILTKGVSSTAFATDQLYFLGKDKYGVFPLKGKLLNVREASHEELEKNTEIQNIKKILGLQEGKIYENVNELRYGHLMIMTDEAVADIQRSIPSMVDGLKPHQRKILFYAFRKPIIEEIGVAEFSGYVFQQSPYHQGAATLVGTIIGMAQNFVGSNNINLLQLNGQFGTRLMGLQGGKDHADGTLRFTWLSPITRYIFHQDDELFLNYLNEDGQSIEPAWFIPIIPMVLVNGSEATGAWSSFIPNYNPRDVIANLERLLAGKKMWSMLPWITGNFNFWRKHGRTLRQLQGEGAADASDTTRYDYLLAIAIPAFEVEDIKKMEQELYAKKEKIVYLNNISIKDLWRKDLRGS